MTLPDAFAAGWHEIAVLAGGLHWLVFGTHSLWKSDLRKAGKERQPKS